MVYFHFVKLLLLLLFFCVYFCACMCVQVHIYLCARVCMCLWRLDDNPGNCSFGAIHSLSCPLMVSCLELTKQVRWLASRPQESAHLHLSLHAWLVFLF